MNMILTMSSFIFPIITFPYTSRILLPDGTGKVSFAVSFISYFTMIAQLGIPTYGIRICAMVRDDRKKLTQIVHELLSINIFMSLVSYIALFIILLTVPKLEADRLLYVIVSSDILLTALGIEWLYKALEQYTYIALRSLAFKAIAVILMFLLVHEQKDYVIYGGISIFASCASNLMNLFHVHRFIDMKPVGGYDIKRHIKTVAIFFAMSCATTLYLHMDTVMLKFIASDDEVGYYTAATKIKYLLVCVVTSLGAVLLPRLSYTIKQNDLKEFRRLTCKAMQFVLFISVPLTVYFILFAPEGIELFSGEKFDKAIKPMRCIMPTVIFIGVTNVTGLQILVPQGKEKIVLYSEITGAIVNLLLNFLLIPFFYSLGASIGTVAAELAVLIVQYLALRKDGMKVFKGIRYAKNVIAILIGTISAVWVKFLGLGSFWALMISAILFFGVYVIVLLLFKDQLMIELMAQGLVMLRKEKNDGGAKKS